MDSVNTLINKVSEVILKPLIFGMFGIASVVFLWGINNFIGGADNPEKRSAGAQQMIWGIVGMAIMIGAIVIKNIVAGTAIKL